MITYTKYSFNTAEYLSVNMTLFRVYNVHTLLGAPLLHHSIPLTFSSQGSVTILADQAGMVI